MVLTAEQRRQSRATALAATKKAMTKAHKIHRNFVAGRPPASELRSAAEAIGLAKVLLREIQAAMIEYKLNPADSVVRIAFVTKDLSMAYARNFVPGGEASLLKDLMEQPVIMLGLLFCIVDREADPTGDDVVCGMKPFLVTKQVIGWLQDLLGATHNGLN
jgi:hypothetical protein